MYKASSKGIISGGVHSGIVYGDFLAHAVGDCLHQVLKIGKDVGVGFVPVFGHHHAVDDNVEFPVGARCELEGAYIFTYPA